MKYDNRRLIQRDKQVIRGLKFTSYIILASIIYLILVALIVRPYKNHGESMYPTYQNNDYLLLDIVTPQTSSIKRFDIVVVNDKNNDDVLSRVVALPGEVIEMKDNTLYIDGKMVKEPFLDASYVDKQTNHLEIPFTSDFGPIKLKDKEYYVLGDNRRIALDSRKMGVIKNINIKRVRVFNLND